jgi:hypothetical protein
MKRSLFLIMALLLATPALGTVTITCATDGEEAGFVRIDYNVSGEPAKVRAFALDVSVDSGVKINDVCDFDTGEGEVYGIFPGSIDLTDPNNPVWNTPIAPSSDPGAEGTGKGTGRVILEMGSLYEPNLTGPPNSGTLCRLSLDPNGATECNVVIVVEPTRGGVVLENGDAVSITSPGCEVQFANWPDCWGWPGQCHGDTALNDLIIDLGDFQAFKAAFGYDYPHAKYNPCADYDRDGLINLGDFQTFKAAFGVGSVTGDCAAGGTWPPPPPP